MIQGPCRGCEERMPGCHSRCEKYASYKEEVAKDSKAEKEHFERAKRYNPWSESTKRRRYRNTLKTAHRALRDDDRWL